MCQFTAHENNFHHPLLCFDNIMLSKDAKVVHSLLVSCFFAVAPHVRQSSPPRDVKPVGAEEVKLMCNVKDAQNYTWYKDNKRILLPRVRYFVKTDRYLRITNVVKSDSGVFVCVASNSYGSVNCTIRLIVEGMIC